MDDILSSDRLFIMYQNDLISQGEAKGIKSVAINFIKMGVMSLEDIAKGTGLSLEEVKAIAKENNV